MNKEIIGDYFISNGCEFHASKITQETITQPSVYEVIRVIKGIPLFLEDHIKRLQLSAASLESNLQDIIPVSLLARIIVKHGKVD